ncbi:hypothetical protein LIER_09928 [Lithospermum erythrorhizon]|uniref:DELLA protein RGL1 n=1 Tax=Lithospermum erythrorhizon TaxID=34254 RepID=A0AAV3PLD6_LITER
MKLKKAKLVCEQSRELGEDGMSSGIATCNEGIDNPEKGVPLSKHQNESQVLKSDHICSLDDERFGNESPLYRSSDEDIKKSLLIESRASHVECKGENRCALQCASFKLFKEYGSRLKKIHGTPINVPGYEDEYLKMANKKLSTNDIIRLAGEKFVELSESRSKDLIMACHLFSEKFSNLKDNARDAELVFYLLASADKVGQKQFDCARKLLDHCEKVSSCVGNPVQRLVYYFSKALNEKIDRETMKTTPLNLGMKQLQDVEEEMMSINSTIIALNTVFPACYIVQLAGTQAIVEHVSEAKKIHIIDFAIKGGQHHSMLIQALAEQTECLLENLKITAVGTTSKSKIDTAGNSLIRFAKSLGVPFSFNVVMVDDILELEEGLLSVDSDETVVVYSAYFLRTMLSQPDRLESLMRMIRNTKPSLMVVAEVESNHNSRVFVNRFIEALFFFGAQFDSLEDCMKNDETNRSIMESFYFSKGIHNTMATEGEQRAFRQVKVEVWRSFFLRFGLLETPLSKSSLSQAKQVLAKYSCGSSCTIDMDGECLIMGWKGTPLYSLSAWRFK